MSKIDKEFFRRVAAAYLRAEEPEELAEFEIVFEPTFAAFGEPGRETPRVEWIHGRLQADSPFLDMPPSAAVIWITIELFHALAEASEGPDLETRLAEIAEQMAEYTRQPGRVAAIATVLREMVATPTVTPADLEIRVTTETTAGETALRYVLHSPSGKLDFFDTTIRGSRFRGRPEEYQAALFATLEKLHKGLGSHDSRLDSAEVGTELEALGQELYHELFPAELKTAYRRFRDQAETLLVISDEPWIPWELVKPYDDSDPEDIVDDDFLCCRFQLTRWLADSRPPAAVIQVEQLAAIEAGSPPDLEPLVHADSELRLVGGLAARYASVEDRSLRDATHPRVTALLQEHDLGLLHFIGHGELYPQDPNASGFWLHDGRTLRPRDLYGAIQTRLKRNQPLVFFNACQVARQGWSLTRLGGWAQRFVHDQGCGAFVGPQWTVGDEQAHDFAKALYGALERGETFGRAVRHARDALTPQSPGRLAYSIYGHPNGRLHLGTKPPRRISEAEFKRSVQ